MDECEECVECRSDELITENYFEAVGYFGAGGIFWLEAVGEGGGEVVWEGDVD